MEQGRNSPRHGAGQIARRRIAASALVLGLAGSPAAAFAGEPQDGHGRGELLVRFSGHADASTRAEVRRDADVRLEDGLPLPGLELVRLEAGTSAAQAVERLEAEPGVLYAEPNHYRTVAATPTDTYFAELWGLHNSGQAVGGVTGTPDADVDGPEVWDVVTGDPAVTVGIVDSGVSRTHPDLGPNTWVNPGETGAGRDSNRVDDDRNGYVDDAVGWDWVDSDADPSDLHGHGTHVAGTVGARGDNGTGVTGVAWRVALMALRVLDENGSGTVADAIEAYSYAGRKGARVLNASLGGPSFSRAEYDAIRSIPGVLFVAAAGNDGRDNDSVPQFPCNYELPNVVCVAATGQRDALAGFSNYGASTVDLAAPGVRILSTWPGGYAYSSGTSMAAPHVSGAAALAFTRPGATSQSVKGALYAGVDALPSLAGRTVTGGRLNAYAALVGHSPAPGPPPPPSPQPASAAPDRTPPQLVVGVTRHQRLRTLLRRGIRVSVRCSEACSVHAQALIGRRTARRGELVARTLILAGRDAAQLSTSRTRTLRIKLRRTAKRRLISARRPRLSVKVTARDPVGNTRAATRWIRAKRSR